MLYCPRMNAKKRIIISGVIITALAVAFYGSTKLQTRTNKIAPSQEIAEVLAPANTLSAPSILIIPHHLVAEEQLKESIKKIAQLRKEKGATTKRIILLGPNHFFRGHAKVIAEHRTWPLSKGTVQQDTAFINKLVQQNLTRLEEKILENDHSITAPLPYIHAQFPDALYVPLLLREPMTTSETDQLANFFVTQTITDDTLIVASIDFSHYLAKFNADLHDEATLAALANRDTIFFQKNVDADSPHILTALTRYAIQKDEYFTLLSHTNSADLMKNPRELSTTSHIQGYFSKRSPTKAEQIVITIGKDQEDAKKFPLIYKGSDYNFFVDQLEKQGSKKTIVEKNGINIEVPADQKVLIIRKKDGRMTKKGCHLEKEQCMIE